MSLALGARAVLTFLLSKGAGTSRGCWWRQKRISEETDIPLRSVQRYLAKLEQLGWIRIQHRQSTTNLYFAKTVENPDENPSVKPQREFPFCRKMAGPHAKVADASIEVNNNTEVKNLSESTTGAALMERTPSEIETLKTQITTFRYRSGAEVEPSPDLLTRLIRKADFYRVSLYVLAAHFERARRTVERVPSSAPESSAWFLAVAENALKSSNVGEKRVVELPPPKHKSATDLERAVKLDELSRKPPDCARWNLSDRMVSKHGFDGSIAELARRKKLG